MKSTYLGTVQLIAGPKTSIESGRRKAIRIISLSIFLMINNQCLQTTRPSTATITTSATTAPSATPLSATLREHRQRRIDVSKRLRVDGRVDVETSPRDRVKRERVEPSPTAATATAQAKRATAKTSTTSKAKKSSGAATTAKAQTRAQAAKPATNTTPTAATSKATTAATKC